MNELSWWKKLYTSVQQTTDVFVLACLVRAIFDLVYDPETFRTNHAGMPGLTQEHAIDPVALAELWEVVAVQKNRLLQNFRTRQDHKTPVFTSPEVAKLCSLCQRTLDAIDQKLGRFFILKQAYGGYSAETLVRVELIPLDPSKVSVVPVIPGQDVCGFMIAKELLAPFQR